MVRVGLDFCLRDCYRCWRFLLSCSDFCQLCQWCCTWFNVVCRRLGIYHCCWCLSARSSQCFFFFLLQLWLCHLSMGALVYQIPSWFLEVWIFPSADLETYYIIPQRYQVKCYLHGMVVPLGLHFLGDQCQWLLSSCMTLVSLLWFRKVFQVWNGWGCDLILVILFLFLRLC